MSEDGKRMAERIAQEILRVQPIDPKVISAMRAPSMSEADLRAQGYRPICGGIGLIWIKDDD